MWMTHSCLCYILKCNAFGLAFNKFWVLIILLMSLFVDHPHGDWDIVCS